MVRPPYQGLGQTRLLEIAGAVIPLNRGPKRATDLVTATPPAADSAAFDMTQMLDAPKGRADDFGVGVEAKSPEEATVAPPAASVVPIVTPPASGVASVAATQ